MTIRFTKKRDKSGTLTCVRDDGSITWAPSSVGTPHDLLHYAVETGLDYHRAFFGLVAQGRDIGDFGTRNGKKDVYPAEALWTEAIVGIFQSEMMSGGCFSCSELAEILARLLPGLPLPQGLTDEALGRLRSSARVLLERWYDIPNGGTMELVFPA